METKLLSLSVILMCGLSAVLGHVALTYPPARKYDLDFLDTFRTPKPCGGMKPSERRTTIQSGRDVSITWHMGNPHRGGFKLELLDKNGNLIKELTPSGLFAGAEDIHTQKYTINLDRDLTCQECILRLERQALEWGDDYRFHSCADIDIIANQNTDCSGHGRATGSSCVCERTYFGDRCQYKQDCESDADCRNFGRCIDIKGTSFPSKQCFCQPGHHGLNCEKTSNLTSADFDPALYERIPGRNVDFFWRKLNPEEFEAVMVGKTDSFVAVGWRPESLDKNCQSFPEDAAQPTASQIHGMDCTDIVVGTVRDGVYSRVLDLYTRDRSTPRMDSVFDGDDDITGAVGKEQDGVTTIIFRKRTLAETNTDHDFIGPLHFIWAHGRSDDDFFGNDEFKYHGGGNRGSVKVEVSSSTHVLASLLTLATCLLLSLKM